MVALDVVQHQGFEGVEEVFPERLLLLRAGDAVLGGKPVAKTLVLDQAENLLFQEYFAPRVVQTWQTLLVHDELRNDVGRRLRVRRCRDQQNLSHQQPEPAEHDDRRCTRQDQHEGAQAVQCFHGTRMHVRPQPRNRLERASVVDARVVVQPRRTSMFALLEHDTSMAAAVTPAERGRHWDLLVEVPGCERLPTWRLERNPLVDAGEISAQRIGDHRRRYLEYEGEISGGAGWCAGSTPAQRPSRA